MSYYNPYSPGSPLPILTPPGQPTPYGQQTGQPLQPGQYAQQPGQPVQYGQYPQSPGQPAQAGQYGPQSVQPGHYSPQPAQSAQPGQLYPPAPMMHPGQPTQIHSPDVVGGNDAYVLMRSRLPVAPGEPVLPHPPLYQSLVPTGQEWNGLSIYGPERLDHLKQDSKAKAQQPAPSSVPKSSLDPVVSPSAGNAQAPIIDVSRVVFHMVASAHADTKDSKGGLTIIDPDLSVRGKQQCRNLKTSFQDMEHVRYIFCSPATSALQTTHFTFGEQMMRASFTKKAMAWPAIRSCNQSETVAKGIPPYHRGSTITDLREKLKGKNLWISNSFEGWEKDEKEYWSQKPRAEQVRKDLYQLALAVINGGKWKFATFEATEGSRNIHIAVVSHCIFLNVFTRGECRPTSGPSWSYIQHRSYTFPSPSQIGKTCKADTLLETKESRERAHVMDAVPKPPKAGWGDA